MNKYVNLFSSMDKKVKSFRNCKRKLGQIAISLASTVDVKQKDNIENLKTEREVEHERL